MQRKLQNKMSQIWLKIILKVWIRKKKTLSQRKFRKTDCHKKKKNTVNEVKKSTDSLYRGVDVSEERPSESKDK